MSWQSRPGRPSRRWLVGAATALLTVLLTTVGGVLPTAAADGSGADGAGADGATGGAPSRAEVDAARGAVTTQRRDVAAVQDDLVAANQRLQDSAIAASQAAEAWNGARYELSLARRDARRAAAWLRQTRRELVRQRAAYGDTLAAGYELAPEVSALEAMTRADGIEEVVEQSSTLENASTALDQQYDRFRALAAVADVASGEAARTRRRAATLEQTARDRRDEARAASDHALATASAIAAERDRLVAELARLQDISVELARRRQSALERAAAEAAAAAARARVERAAGPVVAARSGASAPAEPSSEPSDPAPEAPAPEAPAPEAPAPDPEAPAPEAPAPEAPYPEAPAPEVPAPGGGAGAAIAYARAQIGEPYRWGAAGPASWDCSGLTMRAWGAGGRSLPHYSVAQHAQSTPVPLSALRPGDLVFWAAGASPSSIYHVGLYVGDGRMVHAPRTGRDVEEVSLYSWLPPTHAARP